MAALKQLISHARRHILYKPSLSLRSFSSQNDAPSPPNPIQPVSYPTKPSLEPQPEPEPESPAPQPVSYPTKPSLELEPEPESPAPQPEPWTRDDIRYVKDSTVSPSPVSYPTRVAPLPEDKVDARISWELEREGRRIESRRRLFGSERKEEEEVNVGFPGIIHQDKRVKLQPLDLAEAIRQVKANARRSFDESIEAHVRLGIDRKRTDLTVRGTVAMPHGVGKVVKIAFFAEGADADEARAAGADIVGGVELVEEIARSGKLNADKCFSTPQFMTNLTKIARILGPQGLMPVPKRGTVTSDVSGAVKEAKRGVVDFKMDKTAIVHVGLGKVSYPEESLRENLCAFVNALLLAKPAGLKKTSKYAGYVNSFHICSTMGPGFPVSIQSVSKATDQYTKVLVK